MARNKQKSAKRQKQGRQNNQNNQGGSTAVAQTDGSAESSKRRRIDTDYGNDEITSSGDLRPTEPVLEHRHPSFFTRHWTTLRRWWPCRIWRWVRLSVPAFLRGVLHQDYFNFVLLFSFFIAVFFACWAALEGLMHIVQQVSAESNCGTVYVTIPGPIITVSLIGGPQSISDSVTTYSSSRTSGKTTWLGGGAPPINTGPTTSGSPTHISVPPGIPQISSMSRSSASSATIPNSPSLSKTNGDFTVSLPRPSTPSQSSTKTSKAVSSISTSSISSSSVTMPSSPTGTGLMTRVLSYGDEGFTFAFPDPKVTTTRSFWTGTYPTITGSEISSLAMTTRTVRQSPLSALSSLKLARALTVNPSTLVTATNSVLATGTSVSVATAEPTLCGEYGNFTLNFDDTTVTKAENDVLPVNGMNNPYHHLFYANGFTYVPDKWEPFRAVSQPNVAMFLPLTGKLLPNNAFAGTLLAGEIGAGPRAPVNAYWFNAWSGYFGCSLNGITPCTLRITGYRYDVAMKQEVVVAEQNVTIPACWGYIGCRLTEVPFNDKFRGLSGIQFNAYTYNLGIPQVFIMDDLNMEWFNNSCAAGILRIGHHFGPGS